MSSMTPSSLRLQSMMLHYKKYSYCDVLYSTGMSPMTPSSTGLLMLMHHADATPSSMGLPMLMHHADAALITPQIVLLAIK